jgi:hypothetical protein
MAKRWLQATDVMVDDETGALLVAADVQPASEIATGTKIVSAAATP